MELDNHTGYMLLPPHNFEVDFNCNGTPEKFVFPLSGFPATTTPMASQATAMPAGVVCTLQGSDPRYYNQQCNGWGPDVLCVTPSCGSGSQGSGNYIANYQSTPVYALNNTTITAGSPVPIIAGVWQVVKVTNTFVCL